MKTYYDSFVLCKSNHNTYIIPHTVMKSRYTNVKYHCEISWYFSVSCLPQSLRNYKEEAKIKPSEKALAMPGQWQPFTSRSGNTQAWQTLYSAMLLQREQFSPNPHQRHSITHPLGSHMGCLPWFPTLFYILLSQRNNGYNLLILCYIGPLYNGTPL